MLSGRGLCDELITRPEEPYRLCCVVVLTKVEIGLDVRVNADHNKYVVMSRDQNAGRRHNTKIDNSSVEGEWNS